MSDFRFIGTQHLLQQKMLGEDNQVPVLQIEQHSSNASKWGMILQASKQMIYRNFSILTIDSFLSIVLLN